MNLLVVSRPCTVADKAGSPAFQVRVSATICTASLAATQMQIEKNAAPNDENSAIWSLRRFT
jgi:hypothetical protein